MSNAPTSPAWSPQGSTTLAALAEEAGVSMDEAWQALNEAWDHPSFPGGVSTHHGGAMMMSEAASWVRNHLAMRAARA